MKIILIEDDRFLSDLYKNQLEKAGHTVLQVFDPSVGLDFVSSEKPELVILDLIMPKFSGMEILKKVKANKDLKDTKVIVLSNIRDEKIIKEATDLGAGGYIIKTTVTPDQIPEEIKKYL